MIAAVHHPMWQKLNTAALSLLRLKSRKIYEKAYGPRAEKCYFTPARAKITLIT
jgi:hypothetical protein